MVDRVNSRAFVDYTVRTAPKQFKGFDVDAPIAGLYRMKLISGGVFVAIRIWWGAPLDPIDGSELDRSPRWQATANGGPISLERVWPRCAAEPIDKDEAAYLIATAAWAKQHAPHSARADPRRRINLLSEPLPQF